MATKRFEERKTRDREARRAQIVSAARTIAEQEGWSHVTMRRLSDEISYSQPVLYSHFENREAILAAVAVEAFRELGIALEKARNAAKHGHTIEALAKTYLKFASTSPAVYEVMFTLSLSVPFDHPATPPELHFAFAQLLHLFPKNPEAAVLAEVLWASLHGFADLTRTQRLPASRQKERVKALVEWFR